LLGDSEKLEKVNQEIGGKSVTLPVAISHALSKVFFL